MLIKTLKNCLRIMLRQKLVSIISLAGLSIGLASSFLIIGFLNTELSYDRFHQDLGSIYRVVTNDTTHQMKYPWSPYVLGNTVREEVPGVRKVVSMNFAEDVHFRPVGTDPERDFEFLDAARFICADSTFFSVFSFRLLEGRAEDVFSKPLGVAISGSMARKFFPGGSPVGKQLQIRYKGEEALLDVRAVFRDMPDNSSIQADFIAGMDLGFKLILKDMITSGGPGPDEQQIRSDWGMAFFPTFFVLQKGTGPGEVEQAMNELSRENYPSGSRTYSLQPLKDIHLHSTDMFNIWITVGDIKDVYLFSMIGILLLLVATTNFVILQTASTLRRTRESAVRKILGAKMRQLYQQHIVESLLYSLIALPLALILVETNLPLINRLFNTDIVIYRQHPVLFLIFLGLTLFIGLLSGWYTATFISRTPPVKILLSAPLTGQRKAYFRRGLILFQLISFTGLLVATSFVYRQTGYMLNADPGYNHEHMIKLRIKDDAFATHYPTYLEKIRQLNGVEDAAGTLWAPPNNSVFSMTLPQPRHPEETVVVELMHVDYGFMETMGFRLKSGRFFSRERGADQEAVILNEAACRQMGLDEPLGTSTALGPVIGVVEDFHVHSMHSPYKPTMFLVRPEMVREIVVRYSPGTSFTEIRKEIIAACQEIGPEADISVRSFDDEFRDLYQAEIRLLKVLNLFTILIIVIASMGLFGLSMFLTELRTREIGIRKVMGAGIFQVVRVVSMDFIWMTLLANALSWPLAWYLVNRWLQDFPFRAPFAWWIFPLVGALSLVLVMIALSFQAWHAARTNPAETVKYE